MAKRKFIPPTGDESGSGKDEEKMSKESKQTRAQKRNYGEPGADVPF